MFSSATLPILSFTMKPLQEVILLRSEPNSPIGVRPQISLRPTPSSMDYGHNNPLNPVLICSGTVISTTSIHYHKPTSIRTIPTSHHKRLVLLVSLPHILHTLSIDADEIAYASHDYSLSMSSSMGFDLNEQPQGLEYRQSQSFGQSNINDHPNINDHLSSLSRHSSYSSFTSLSNDGFASNSNEGLFAASSMGSQLLPPTQQMTITNVSSRPILPPIQVNAFSTPGKIGRPRSTSRITPYSCNRHHRSSSISTVASIDSNAPTSAHTSDYASFRPSNLASPQRGLAQGMGKMSLHHRRTSSKNSNYPTVKKQTSRSILSRAGRSASMSVLRASNSAPFDFSGIGHDKASTTEDQVQASLFDKAEKVSLILSTTQQDKARTAWVRCWLQKAYTSTPSFTVPRQGLYHSYCLSSEVYGLKPINAASFGKAVRAAYPGIRTRRLGHRGSSKYHYVSLRPALSIEAQRLNEYPESNG